MQEALYLDAYRLQTDLTFQSLKKPVMLIVEDNVGSKARAFVFCRVESRGMRMTPSLSRDVKPEALYDAVAAKFSFHDP